MKKNGFWKITAAWIGAVLLLAGCSTLPKDPVKEADLVINDILMTYVAPGNFKIGYTDVATPVHKVFLSGYRIAKYETGYTVWYNVMAWALKHGYVFANEGREGDDGKVGWYPVSGEEKPVTSINWRDCVAWCNAFSEAMGYEPVYSNQGNTAIYKNSVTDGDIGNGNVNWNANGFRLPTEAEWEFAARFVNKTNFTAGDLFSGCNVDGDIDHAAWYSNNCDDKVWPVAQKTTNSLGLYDMSGNMNEWCWDAYGVYSSDVVTNPRGLPFLTGGTRVLRGGGGASETNCLDASKRHDSDPGTKGHFIGFRVVRSSNN